MKTFGAAAILAAVALSGCCLSHSFPLDGSPPDGGDTPPADGPGCPTGFDECDAHAPDVLETCSPQDAHAQGPCTAILPGVVWNGTHCVPLGSGCTCAGADCGALYDAVASCVAARIACYPGGCDAQAVADDSCVPSASCDQALLGTFWDGRACFDLWGCGCRGAGCPSLFASMDECAAVHARCDASLCQATGGAWFVDACLDCSLCGDCVHVKNCPAFGPYSTCNCGLSRTFVSGVGCATDSSCGPARLCEATGGTWTESMGPPCVDFRCGMGSCGCNCGPGRNFDSTSGCLADPSCGATEQQICEASGGTWVSACCPILCGMEVLCGIACTGTEMGCNCGATANFDPAGRCRPESACTDRGANESCGQWTCRAGLACCGSGVADWGICQSPCCPSDPSCGPNGCYPAAAGL